MRLIFIGVAVAPFFKPADDAPAFITGKSDVDRELHLLRTKTWLDQCHSDFQSKQSEMFSERYRRIEEKKRTKKSTNLTESIRETLPYIQRHDELCMEQVSLMEKARYKARCRLLRLKAELEGTATASRMAFLTEVLAAQSKETAQIEINRGACEELIMKKRKKRNHPLAFFNWDGCCVVDSLHSVLLSLKHFSTFFQRRAPLETSLRQLSTCGLPISNSNRIRHILGLYYVNGGFWGGIGVPTYLRILIPKLPLLHAACRCAVVDRYQQGRQSVEFLHHLVLVGTKCVQQLLNENALQFLSLPSLLIFIIDNDWFEGHHSLRGSNFEVKVTAVNGSSRKYSLRGSIEVQGGHAYSHVKHRDDNWYEVNNHLVKRLRPYQVVGDNSVILIYEMMEEESVQRKRLIRRANHKRKRSRVEELKDD